MSQKKSIFETNRKKALIRWSREEKKHKLHLNSIVHSRKYKLLKSRLCGFLAGDGHVSIRKENKRKNAIHHSIDFYPDHRSMIDSFIEAFIYLYTKKPTIKKEGNYYRVRASSKSACLDLLKDSTFGIHRWRVPLRFLDSEECRAEWLRAFFDCEGYVGDRDIRIQSVNKTGLLQVKGLLNGLGIESKMYKHKRKNDLWSTNHILCILKKSSREQYLNKVGFNHILKLKKLRMQIASVPESGKRDRLE